MQGGTCSIVGSGIPWVFENFFPPMSGIRP